MAHQPRFDPESHGAGPVNRSAPLIHKWSRVLYEYNEGESCLPPPRSGAASVVLKDKLYMFGGFGGGTGRLDDFYSFDFATLTWEEVKPLGDEKPGCRENNGVVISGSSRTIILFGGYNGTQWLNDLWSFDITTKRWTCIQESSDLSDVYATDETSAAVGMPTAAEGPPVGDEGLEGLTQNSTHISRKRPCCRFGYLSLIHDNKLIVWGGFDGTKWLNDMYIFDFESLTWNEIRQLGTSPSRRSCPAWAKDEKCVYLHGGYDGVERKDE